MKKIFSISLALLFLIFPLGKANALTFPTVSVAQGIGLQLSTAGSAQGLAIPIANIASAGVVLLCSGAGSSVANGFYGLYSQSAPANTSTYKVPSGKVFYGIMGYYMASNTNAAAELGSGTAPLIAEGTTSAPTGVIYYGNSANNTSNSLITNSTTYQASVNMLGVNFAALSYPFMKVNSTTTVYLFCIQGIVQ